MIVKAAKIRDNTFIKEVDSFRDDKMQFHLWWLGQSGYLLMWQGKKILIDPYLSDSLTVKYAASNKPHVRISERVVDPWLLKDITLVTSSHNHTDHLDAETLIPIFKQNPSVTFIIPEANRDFVCERLMIARTFPVGLSDGISVAVDEFEIRGFLAKHNEIERDAFGNSKFLGYIFKFGEWTIYHSGDTLHFKGMEELLTSLHIDVALLPVNGNDPRRGVAGNFNSSEAAALAKNIGARVAIPCHYDMFAFNSTDPREFEKEALMIKQDYKILELGGQFSSEYFSENRIC